MRFWENASDASANAKMKTKFKDGPKVYERIKSDQQLTVDGDAGTVKMNNL